jgi:recombination protein RecA
VANNVVEKSGSWHSYRGERIGQGRENARVFLKEHPEIAVQIDTELRTKLGILGGPAEQGIAVTAALKN